MASVGRTIFRCPNGWTRKEGEGLVDYIGRWFVWERVCPSAEVVQEWQTTALVVEEYANRGRTVTFHAGPRELCPPSIRSVDVHNDYNIKGVPSGLQARVVTGVDKKCVNI